MNKLGVFVRGKRLQTAMNQSEFANEIGITMQTLSKIENGGKCGSVVMKKLSNYLNISTKLLREMMINES